MNTSSNAMPAVESPAVVRAEFPAGQIFYWAVRRELWENRSLYLAPLGAAVVFLVGFAIGVIRLPHKMRGLAALDAAQQHRTILLPYDMAAGMIMLTAMVVGIFYSLDTLQGERRDRSILFWKSLPVSDWMTVLSKASIPLVVLPLLTSAILVVTYGIMVVLSAVALTASGVGVATLWAQLCPFQLSAGLVYHLITVHALWHAPFYGWMLLVSAWSRRNAFLWAFLPPLAIGVVEKMALGTSHFANLLMQRLSGGPEAMQMAPGVFPIDPGMHYTLGRFLVAPGLWGGLIITAGFLLLAVRLRKYRGPV